MSVAILEYELLPVFFLLNLNIGLVLSLLVLKRAIQQQDTGIVDLAAHSTWRHDILLEHDPTQHSARQKCMSCSDCQNGV